MGLYKGLLRDAITFEQTKFYNGNKEDLVKTESENN